MMCLLLSRNEQILNWFKVTSDRWNTRSYGTSIVESAQILLRNSNSPPAVSAANLPSGMGDTNKHLCILRQ
jgi:hypothetical protein